MTGFSYWRRRRGLTVSELADRCRIHWSTLEAIESGRYFPRFGQIEKIADALGIRTVDLLDADAVAESRSDYASSNSEIKDKFPDK